MNEKKDVPSETNVLSLKYASWMIIIDFEIMLRTTIN